MQHRKLLVSLIMIQTLLGQELHPACPVLAVQVRQVGLLHGQCRH